MDLKIATQTFLMVFWTLLNNTLKTLIFSVPVMSTINRIVIENKYLGLKILNWSESQQKKKIHWFHLNKQYPSNLSYAELHAPHNRKKMWPLPERLLRQRDHRHPRRLQTLCLPSRISRKQLLPHLLCCPDPNGWQRLRLWPVSRRLRRQEVWKVYWPPRPKGG